MGKLADVASWIPGWVERLAVALWIAGPSRRIHFVNEAAERLLGISAADAVGRPCAEVVGGRGADGHPICGDRCPLRRAAECHEQSGAPRMQIRGGRWVQLLAIPLDAPNGSGPWMVECALDFDRAHRIEGYLTKVARRTPSSNAGERARRLAELTPRESEILKHLANDEDVPQIGAELFISHTTVRNHVQNILRKLDVHSLVEAVALELLERSDR